ncbi:MAG: restriction endonuclease subunit S, partial [Campylobacter sp.]|nr:restriction endonuclease subunit S [Campylobacter sp.]
PNEANTITATVIGNYKYVKFQKEPYYCSQNINKLKPNFNINERIAIFIMAYIQKFVSQYNGQQGGYKLEELKYHQIYLPIDKFEKPNFDFMENFIKAIQKLVIKDVVLWADKKINATKQVIAKH